MQADTYARSTRCGFAGERTHASHLSAVQFLCPGAAQDFQVSICTVSIIPAECSQDNTFTKPAEAGLSLLEVISILPVYNGIDILLQ